MTDTLVVLCTLGLRAALGTLGPAFERQAGFRLDVRYESSNALMQRIAAGERADLAILTDAALETLAREGRIGARTDLVLSRVGIAVRAGAAKPEIGTVDAFVGALRAARSIAYTRTGASGIHFARVITRLGIDDEINAKASVQDGFTGELAARGEAELAVQQLSELAAVTGVDIVGPIPEELQQVTTFSAAAFANADHLDQALTLVRYLSSREAEPVMRACGLEPVR
jgi:molybdate transport system substrate-binding protein